MRKILSLAIALLLLSPLDSLAQSTPDSLDQWLKKLAAKECLNCPPDFKRIDTNGRFSYGQFQYQEGTFVSQAMRYGLLVQFPNADALERAAFKDAINDYRLQRELTKTMFLNDPNAWKHWRCSIVGCPQYNIKGIGCPPVKSSCPLP